MPRAPGLALLLSLCGCARRAPATPSLARPTPSGDATPEARARPDAWAPTDTPAAPDATPAAPDVTPATPDATPAAPDATSAAPEEAPTTPALIDVNATTVDHLVQLPDGAVLLRAMNREGRSSSDIIATRLDVDGVPVGVPRLLRRTTGPVVRLVGSAHDGALWLAWGAMRPVNTTHAEHLVAAMRVRADLATAQRPIALQDFRAIVGDGGRNPEMINRLEVEVLAVSGGGAVVVSSSPATLRTMDPHLSELEETRLCRGWTVSHIAADGSVRREESAAFDHVAGPSSLVALPGGFAFVVTTGRFEVTTPSIEVRALDPAAVAPVMSGPAIGGYRDAHLARLGDSLFAVGTPTLSDMAASDTGHVWVNGPQRNIARWILHANGRSEWPAVNFRALRCQSGRPVIQLRWAGGRATLDPIRDGAPLDWSAWVARSELPGLEGAAPTPPLAWTGRVLVAWDAGGWNRYRCGPRGAITAAP